jgi:hypothetical protein
LSEDLLKRASLSIVGAALAILTPQIALPAAPPRIVVIADEDWAHDSISSRLRAELRTVGFEVTVLPAPPADTPRRALEEAALHDGAVAAVRLTPSRDRIEVWIVDRITGKTVLRDLTIPEADPDRDATIALRTVELLRASLMEIDAPHPPRGDAPAPPAIRAMAQLAPIETRLDIPRAAAPDAARYSIEVGPTMIVSPGGLAPLAALSVGAHAFLHPRISVGVSGFLPLTAARVDGVEGSSTSRVFVVSADATAHFGSRDARWDPQLGAGAVLLVLHTEGTGRAPSSIGLSSDSVSAGLFLRPGVGVALGDRLHLRADLLTGVALSRFALDYAGRTAATWGWPFVVASLGLEVELR